MKSKTRKSEVSEHEHVIRKITQNNGGALTTVIPPQFATHMDLNGGNYITMSLNNNVLEIRKATIK